MDEQVLITSSRGGLVKRFFEVAGIIGAVAGFFLWIVFSVGSLPQNAYRPLDLIIYVLICEVIAFVIAVVIYLPIAPCSMTISNMRVYGIAAFNKRVDLPLDSVSSFGTSWLNGIGVATSSGFIKFYLIENRDEMHDILNKLMMDRQTKEKSEIANPSTVDEIKEYKSLLDEGVITQEEFDRKKKQLLGL